MRESVVVAAPDAFDVEPAHDLLTALWAAAPSVGDLDRVAFETALVELVGNVLQHAAADGVTWRLDVEVLGDRLVGTITDTGPGLVPDLDRPMPDVLAESGRGLPMVRALVDDLSVTPGPDGCTWRIERRRAA